MWEAPVCLENTIMSQILGRMVLTFWIPFRVGAMHGNDDLLGFRVLQLGYVVTLLDWKTPTCVALNMMRSCCFIILVLFTEPNSVF